MNFVITGGAGFIGSHLSRHLLEKGHHVTIVDRLSTGAHFNLPNSPKLRLLIKDIAYCSVEDFVSPIDGLVHLAADASVARSWLFLEDVHQNNLSNVLKIIELSKSLNIPRIVFASSAAVYGSNANLPIVETEICHPISPYGLQKLSAERYLELFASQVGFSTISLRLFNVYGPGQLPNSEYAGVISKFIKALDQNQPIIIYGDGSQTRDFVYVRDVSRAFEQALFIPLSSGQSFSYNIGTGNAISVNQLMRVLLDLTPKSSSELHYAPARRGDIQNSWCDITLAKKYLQFEALFSIRTGLQDYFNAEKETVRTGYST